MVPKNCVRFFAGMTLTKSRTVLDPLICVDVLWNRVEIRITDEFPRAAKTKTGKEELEKTFLILEDLAKHLTENKCIFKTIELKWNDTLRIHAVIIHFPLSLR